jgi:hypothetical protein
MPKTSLTADQIAAFRKDGFVVIEDFLTASELETWRVRITHVSLPH